MTRPAPADVVLLSGPPGAGKTTTARRLAAGYPRAVHLHSDDFWHVIVTGAVAPFLPGSDEQNRTVMTVIGQAARTYAEGGYTTVVDGIIGPWMLPLVVEHAARLRIHYVVLRPDRAEALRRARERSVPGALVEEGPVTGMWDQFADLGVLERHVLDTTAHRPEETLAAVRAAIDSDLLLLPALPGGTRGQARADGAGGRSAHRRTHVAGNTWRIDTDRHGPFWGRGPREHRPSAAQTREVRASSAPAGSGLP